MLGVDVTDRWGRRPRRVLRHAVSTVLTALLVVGVLSMHVLIGTVDPRADPDRADSSTATSLTTAANDGPAAAHATRGDVSDRGTGHGTGHSEGHGGGNLLAGACLTLLGGLVGLALVARRRLGWSVRALDIGPRLSAAWSARGCVTSAPDLHALSILRC